MRTAKAHGVVVDQAAHAADLGLLDHQKPRDEVKWREIRGGKKQERPRRGRTHTNKNGSIKLLETETPLRSTSRASFSKLVGAGFREIANTTL